MEPVLPLPSQASPSRSPLPRQMLRLSSSEPGIASLGLPVPPASASTAVPGCDAAASRTASSSRVVAVAAGLGALGGLLGVQQRRARRARRQSAVLPLSGAGSREQCQVAAASFAGGLRRSAARSSTACQVFDRFREDAITAIYCAQEEALRQGYGVVCTELVLFGILSEEQKGTLNKVARGALIRTGVTREAVRQAVSNLLESRGPTVRVTSRTLPFSDNAKRLFDTANASIAPGQDIGSEELLLILGQPDFQLSGAARVLVKLGVRGDKLQKALEDEKRAPSVKPTKELAAVGGSGGDKKMALDEVATDLTALARQGLLDPVIGREDEMQRIIQILLRRRKNNACLVGPPGVGKTAVAEGLAQRIAAGKVPPRLRGKQLYSLDLGLLVAGTKYRGEFEERLKAVIQEVSSGERDICLFIDEIHQLVGAGVAGPDSSMDAANLLKPALARGELQVIGATTSDEYTRFIEKDAALERRFQKVTCEEPSVAETIQVLTGLRDTYEDHHGVLLSADALNAAARLSSRYIPDRFLPDKAVDLIDEAGSLVQLRMEAELEEASQQMGGAPVDLPRPVVTADDIARVISKWSGVPVERLSEDESHRLMRLEETLGRRLVGQKEAVSALSRAVRRARAGLAGFQRPIASLYFAGPTGVGKTELCKVLAAEYFTDSKALIRLDMSEYSEQHSVSRLVGPPPGYVGFDDPRSGQLTEAVRRRPYSVVVFDEIEKAHPEVLNLLLQVLEDGRLTDGKGRTVSFANCIIIMTSNIGSREILDQARGQNSYEAMRAAVQVQLQQRFRPEFLNRIDELLVFRALQLEDLQQIAHLALSDAAKRASDAYSEAVTEGSKPTAPLKLAWTAAFEKLILEKGADSTYGARPLRRAVQRFYEDPLAELLVTGAFNNGGTATLDIADGNLVVQYEGRTLRPQFAAGLSDKRPETAQASTSVSPAARPPGLAVAVS